VVQRGTRRPCAGFPEGGKHPDCRDDTPLRGGSRDGDLGRCGHAEGSPTLPSTWPPDDHGVLDSLRRRGTHDVLSRACPRGARSTFTPGESTHITHTVTASPILGATDGGIGASPRTRRHEERWPSVPYLPAGLCCPGDGVDGAVWLAACFLPEGRELSHAARFEGGAREAEANATARALLVKRGPPAGAGEDRTLEVVLARL